MKRAKYLSESSIQDLCKSFGIKSLKEKKNGPAGPQSNANEWIPTSAVKKIREIQKRYGGKMNETCVSNILYEFNIIWRDIMRKENEALRKKYTVQIQDLRR